MIPGGVSTYETSEYIEITPDSGLTSTTGFMFYPGGLVDPHAYIRPLGLFALNGYKVIIIKMPANLAVLDGSKALRFINSFSGVNKWIIGGHSLGGTFAANCIKSNPGIFQGLVLMGSYPADGDSLSGWGKPVLSLIGEFDGLATPGEINQKTYLLPTSIPDADPYPAPSGFTRYHTIVGGCHSYFGYYGMQDGDGSPTITVNDQHTEMATFLDNFFLAVSP